MKIPCIINNFNQFEYLVPMVDQLLKFDQLAIYILDNGSSYPPLIKWYQGLQQTSVTVICLNKNIGHRAPWATPLTYQLAWKHKSPYYIVTDPDLDLSKVPMDFLDVMKTVLNTKDVFKVGLSIEFEDLPDCYPCKKQVQDWESQMWALDRVELGNDRKLFKVGVDTTFAMYNLLFTELVPATFRRPSYVKFNCNFIDSAYRLDRPYTARHLPWYLDPNNLSENQKFYVNSIQKKRVNPTSWNLLAFEKLKSR